MNDVHNILVVGDSRLNIVDGDGDGGGEAGVPASGHNRGGRLVTAVLIPATLSKFDNLCLKSAPKPESQSLLQLLPQILP